MRRLLPIVVLVAACSHDTDRANPLDPELTPPVTLAVAADDTAGAARLTWSAYDGTADFDRYLVLRQVFDRQTVDTLTAITDVSMTSWTDTGLNPDTAYVYRVSVINTGGAETSSTEQRLSPLSLPAVRIVAHEFDSVTASASLSWTPYAGPRFRAYRVERTTTSTRRTVLETTDVTDTSHVDTGLRGATDYTYRVVVVTERGEEVIGPPLTDAIHPVVDEWPLEGRFGRLRFNGDTLLAVTSETESSAGRVRVSRFTRDGNLVSELRSDEPTPFGLSTPSYVALASGGWLKANFFLFEVDEQGRAPFQEKPLLEEGELALPPGKHQVDGFLSLLGGVAYFDSIRYRVSDQAVVERNLDGDDGYGWRRVWNDETDGQIVISLGADSTASVQVEADVYIDDGTHLWVGGETGSSVSFRVRRGASEEPDMSITWRTVPRVGESSPADSVVRELSFPFELYRARVYRIILAIRDGRISASLAQRSPMWLPSSPPSGPVAARVLTPVGDEILVSGVGQALTITADGTVIESPEPPADWVSELRVWDAGRFSGIGVCQPAADRLTFGQLFGASASNWPTRLNPPGELGPWLGEDVEPLFYPLSFDVGPDGRIYVFEGGSARVLVFDRDRNYITEFGVRGASPGRFDTGHGGLLGGVVEGERAFYGSIAVDDDGFIYVADMGNNRIQKFAP